MESKLQGNPVQQILEKSLVLMPEKVVLLSRDISFAPLAMSIPVLMKSRSGNESI